MLSFNVWKESCFYSQSLTLPPQFLMDPKGPCKSFFKVDEMPIPINPLPVSASAASSSRRNAARPTPTTTLISGIRATQPPSPKQRGPVPIQSTRLITVSAQDERQGAQFQKKFDFKQIKTENRNREPGTDSF